VHAQALTQQHAIAPQMLKMSQISKAKRQRAAPNAAGPSGGGKYGSGIGGGGGGGGGGVGGGRARGKAALYCPKKGQVLEFVFSEVCACVF